VTTTRPLPVAVEMLGAKDHRDRVTGHNRCMRRLSFRILCRPIEQIAQGEIANGGVIGIRFLQPREGAPFTRASHDINALRELAGRAKVVRPGIVRRAYFRRHGGGCPRSRQVRKRRIVPYELSTTVRSAAHTLAATPQTTAALRKEGLYS